MVFYRFARQTETVVQAEDSDVLSKVTSSEVPLKWPEQQHDQHKRAPRGANNHVEPSVHIPSARRK